MKGIKKNCLSSQYERSMQKNFAFSSHTFQFPSIDWESPVFMIYQPYLNYLVIPPT